MRARRKAAVYLSLLLAVGLLFSCQKPFHTETERYVFIANNVSLPYWQEAQAGFLGAAQTLGVNAEFAGPTTYSPDQELEAFQEAVATRPSGILVSPADAELFKGPIDAAIEAGIPVICVDSDSPESRRILFIGTDNYLAGMESGRLLVNMLRERGLVVLITVPGQFNLEERLRGVQQVLGDYPQLKIGKIVDAKGDPEQADQRISALLEGQERFDGILCLEAAGGPGAAEALHRFGLSGRMPLVAMDKDPDTLDWIRRGTIAATVSQKPYTMGFYGLKFLDDLHHNVVQESKDWRTAPTSPLPSFVDTGIAIVDRQNVEDFLEALDTQRSLF